MFQKYYPLIFQDVTENKRILKTIKPFFTDKTKTSSNIILTENDPKFE